ncbi:hypothetical protein NBRC10513v2_005730 [Rhodotorula toruloides]|uniref:BY PROTMAP: gi/472585168/gb/EMS22734.1/ macrofage activating glycoprotein [Rhodosporidium toruloides NP11] gi/647400066/emb/CDR45171.1/ RHTO0S10e06018g1_1 [Rhodosporidium toruloides] n=1 Tax=Rhodotorula toruloides TaxID=5286 RepID=A0A0K3CCB1_RHOTO|nr:hypothetical protein AAT19DRAFT_14652 [Rhodotorula toruloides]
MLVHSALALTLVSSLAAPVLARSPHGAPAPHLRARAEASAPTASTHAQTSRVVAGAATTEAASATVTAAATKKAAAAEGSPLPLTQYTYAYSDVPYQVNPYKSIRGPQSGYNICNSTTAGDSSQCQTLIANDIQDFCLWGSSLTGDGLDTIGDIEAAVVAYCTTDKHGARVIKPGAITGVQVLKTPAYIQWTGFIDQTALHLTKDDTGGELDPHGADLQGNPLGGLVYSTGLPSGDNQTYLQAVEWNNFIGGGVFCLKLCDPAYYAKHGDQFFCQNKYDRIGCARNMPAAYRDGEFSVCDSELQDLVGVYTEDGQVKTYTQEPEGTVPNPPYTPRVPKSSNCKTYASTELWAAPTTSSASSMSTGQTSSSASSAGVTGHAAAASAGPSDSSKSTTGNGATFLVASSGFLALVAGAAVLLARL